MNLPCLWRPIGVIVLAAILTVACAHTVTRNNATATRQVDLPATPPRNSYRKSLFICRFWHGGPVNRELPATNPTIAGCLSRMGWAPDGLPIDLLRNRKPAALVPVPAVAPTSPTLGGE